MPACLRRPPLGRPRTQPTTPPPAGRGGRENIFERLAWGYDRPVRRNPSTVVVLAGKTSEPVLAAVERSMNVVLVRPADDADGGDGVAVAAAALRRAAGISAPYVLVAADPLATVAAEWSAMWDLSQETHGSERFELRAAEALAAWRANQFELPDYYLVLASETGPAAARPRTSVPTSTWARSGRSARTGWWSPPRPSPPSRRRRRGASSGRCGPAAGGRLSKKCSERSVASTRAPWPNPPTRGGRPCSPGSGRSGRLPSFFVLGGVGGVGAAGGGGPAHDAGAGLLQFPAGCVLGVMVALAERAEVALAAGAGGVGGGVVDLGGDGLGAAAGGAAAGGAGADQVLELPAGGVAVLAVGVVAGSRAMGSGMAFSAARRSARRPGGGSRGPSGRARRGGLGRGRGGPGVGSAGAGVGDGAAVGSR